MLLCIISSFLGFMSWQEVRSQTLVVNIANKGGDVFQEIFDANSTEDVLKLSFQQFDGTLVKHSVDFKASVQTFHLTILPFREFGQKTNQEFCFILPVDTGEFISTDAMSKLRQKNPHTIRRPEEERPNTNFTMNSVKFFPSSPSSLPRSAQELCSSSKVQVFTQNENLFNENISDEKETQNTQNLQNTEITKNLQNTKNTCSSTVSWNEPCLCSYPLCIVWYPCDLKYCKDEQKGAEAVEYRCGIKTCKRCRTFTFEVSNKMDCLWNLIQ